MKAVIIYADESGTHDKTGVHEGSQYPVIAGYAAPVHEWDRFCLEWRAVLNKYGMDYFHSREVRAAKAAFEHDKPITPELKRNPFLRIGSKERLDDFLHTLAKVAGKGNKVPFAGGVKLPIYYKIKSGEPTGEPLSAIEHFEVTKLFSDPFQYCLHHFFRLYSQYTSKRWGNFKCPVSFFFDQNNDPKWRQAVYETFSIYKKQDCRMHEITFADKKIEAHLPLQAADMLAYWLRHHATDLYTNKFKMEEIGRLLLRMPKEIAQGLVK